MKLKQNENRQTHVSNTESGVLSTLQHLIGAAITKTTLVGVAFEASHTIDAATPAADCIASGAGAVLGLLDCRRIGSIATNTSVNLDERWRDCLRLANALPQGIEIAIDQMCVQHPQRKTEGLNSIQHFRSFSKRKRQQLVPLRLGEVHVGE